MTLFCLDFVEEDPKSPEVEMATEEKLWCPSEPELACEGVKVFGVINSTGLTTGVTGVIGATGVTGGLISLVKSGPVKIESRRSTGAGCPSGNRNGEASLDKVGLKAEEVVEIEPGDLILASKLSCLLTALEG